MLRILFALALSLVSFEARADSFAQFNLDTSAPAKLQVRDRNNAWVTVGTLDATAHSVSLSAAGIILSPAAASTTKGIVVNQTVAGTIPFGSTGEPGANEINITSDNGAAALGFNALAINHAFGGTAMTGTRYGLIIQLGDYPLDASRRIS